MKAVFVMEGIRFSITLVHCFQMSGNLTDERVLMSAHAVVRVS